MTVSETIQQLAQEVAAGRLHRRDFLVKAAVLGFSAAAVGPVLAGTMNVALAQDLPEVAREDTLIAVRSAQPGKFIDSDQWNPFIPNQSHQLGSHMLYEPLAFYNAFQDETIMWLAESFEYSADYMSLTIKTRSGITWSDGEPFTAEDVAYTFTQLTQLGAKVNWGADVAQFVVDAKSTDANTLVVNFKVPAPRFFDFVAYKFDLGVYIVPKHIFDGKDWTTFTHFDIANGLPVTTGPWRVVFGSEEQKILDRADTWWGVEAGVGTLPEAKRFVYLPDPGEQGLVAGVISNEYDITTGIQPASFPTVFSGNDKAITWTGKESPFGNVDWWPHSLYLNNEKAPYDDKNVRWAISSYLDRDQIIEFGWSGASSPSTLFVPDYPGLAPFLDAVAPVIEANPYLEFNPDKGDALLTAKGWAKQDGMWHDETGTKVELEIISFFDFTGVGPVVVEQLKRSGIEATYSEPPDIFTRFAAGDYTGCLFGHGGSYSSDVYYSLRLYQSASEKIPGGHLANRSLWHNADYDALVDELYSTSPTDTEKVMEIWTKCINIWLPDYPDIQLTQGYHRLPMNETYWTNWPTQDNPYVNPAHWHLTWPYVMHKVKKVAAA